MDSHFLIEGSLGFGRVHFFKGAQKKARLEQSEEQVSLDPVVRVSLILSWHTQSMGPE